MNILFFPLEKLRTRKKKNREEQARKVMEEKK
jgi:hypothetical protein